MVKKKKGILVEIRSCLRLPYEIAFINHSMQAKPRTQGREFRKCSFNFIDFQLKIYHLLFLITCSEW